MALKPQKFTKTPFKKQAEVLQNLAKNNPTVEDDEKTSLNETAGVLLWLNQLQIHWEDGGDSIPDSILQQVFVGREVQKPAAPVPPA